MKTTLFAGASVGFLILASATAASAQSIDYGAMQQLFNEPVTTSATGSPQRSTEVPVAMEIISAADIKRSGATDLPTILSRVAGLDVLNAGAAGSDISVRGYNKGMSPRLLVLINGRQVYLDHYGYTAWATLPVQLEEIRQIEVVKGPNSALFGFNAVGGVVNIITFNPKFDNVGSVTVRAGAGGHQEISAVKTIKLGDKFSARLSAGAVQMDEWKNNIAGLSNSQLTDPARVSANLDTLTQLNDKTELRIEGSWSNTQISEVISSAAYSPSKYVTSSIKGALASETKLGTLELSAYRNTLAAKHLVAGQRARFDNEITVVSVQDLFKVGAAHTFRVGGEYRHNEVNTAPIGGATVSYDVFAASGMWTWAITDKLSTTAAVRHDTLQLERTGVFPTGFTPRTNAAWDRKVKEASYNLGLVYRPTSLDSVRMTVARGVQVPTLIDFGAVQLKASVGPFTIGVAGNQNLLPSIVTNYELGYDRALPALNAKFGASVFVQKTQDVKGQPSAAQLDVAPTATSLPLISYRNIGDSQMAGIEVKASGKIAGGFHWSGDYTWTDVDDKPKAGYSPIIRTAAFELMTPTYRGNIAFGWENDQWAADGFLRHVGDFQNSIGSTLSQVDSYVALGGRVARQFEQGFTVAISGQNLLEERARHTAGLEAERRVYLTLTKGW
ncbi:TonB-dependent receptor plug domain-containing protein [Caulobacter sp. DWR1-3-2b1]|uniref:TonB-dependent receptor plug domain-containing protein n=1 Tax=Caulobacter sp. DWR1-3-2b1 TaxID=2804670 RepID=UPI003CFBB5AF